MKNITVELCPVGAFPFEDQLLFRKWIWPICNKVNFQMENLATPSACILTVKQDGESICFVPLTAKTTETHPGKELWLHELCPKPGLSKKVLSLGLWHIFEQLKQIMRHTRTEECFVNINDDAEVQAVVAHAGFEHLAFTAENNTHLLRYFQPLEAA
jgi:hypothetical protein